MRCNAKETGTLLGHQGGDISYKKMILLSPFFVTKVLGRLSRFHSHLETKALAPCAAFKDQAKGRILQGSGIVAPCQ